MRRLVFSALGALVLAAPVYAQHVRFIVAGDGRSAGKVSKRPEDKNGLNTVTNKELADAVLREKAQALLFTGDLVYGHANRAELTSMLMDWRAIYEEDYAAGVAVLPCRGNHDAGEAGADEDAAWNTVFSGKYALPQNGPAHEKGLTFTKTIGNVLIIGLDQFVASPDVIAVDQTWLNGVLEKNKKPFIFPFAHMMAFMDGHHIDGMQTDTKRRDAFWESLIAHGVRAFFCGHDHAYDHMSVVKAGPNPGIAMQQFTAGTSGAPFVDLTGYTGKNTIWSLTRVKSLTNHTGYILVDVVGKKATITFKARNDAGQYEPYDTWSYTVR